MSTICPHCGATVPTAETDQPCPACLIRLGLDRAAEEGAGDTTAHRAPLPAAPNVEDLAPLFPQFELLELIGSGGMGAVYRARQKSLNRMVAIKVIRPRDTDRASFDERFSREAQAMAQLSHGNIATVHDFGTAELPGIAAPSETEGVASDTAHGATMYYLVMEHIDGLNLRHLIRNGLLTPQQALSIVPPLCDALQYAHDRGVVHRDIKPENILVDKAGDVRIVDFGLAKLVGETPERVTLTGTHQAVGTPHYMAPEQVESPQDVDHRADIYALGVTIYEMLTGELPIGRFSPPSQKAHVDVRLDEIVLRALEKEPQRRYQHASDIKSAVEDVCSGATIKSSGLQRRPPHAVQQQHEIRQSLVIALGFVGCTAVILTGVAFLIYGLVFASVDDPGWGGYLGSAFGCIVGGGGGCLGTWNSYRMQRGNLDLMADPDWNWFDSLVVIYASIGMMILLAAAVPRLISSSELRYVAALLGGIMAFQGAGFATWRKSQRRSQRAKPTGIDPRVVVVAAGLFTGCLAVVGGVICLALAFVFTPIGSGPFWGWIGAGLGCAVGGGGAVVGTWNTYRTLEGLPDMMTDPATNIIDRGCQTLCLVGVVMFVAGVAGSSLLSRTSVYALLLLGGLIALQSAVFLGMRFLYKRAAS